MSEKSLDRGGRFFESLVKSQSRRKEEQPRIPTVAPVETPGNIGEARATKARARKDRKRGMS